MNTLQHPQDDDEDEELGCELEPAELVAAMGTQPETTFEEIAERMASPHFPARVAVVRTAMVHESRALRVVSMPMRRPQARTRRRRTVGARRARARSPGRLKPEPEPDPPGAAARAAA
jgi:hypothetical protein